MATRTLTSARTAFFREAWRADHSANNSSFPPTDQRRQWYPTAVSPVKRQQKEKENLFWNAFKYTPEF